MTYASLYEIGEKASIRIPDSYDAKIAKICNLWTFWPVIQPINHLFKIRQKAFAKCPIDVKSEVTFLRLLHFLHLRSIGQEGLLSDFEKMVYYS